MPLHSMSHQKLQKAQEVVRHIAQRLSQTTTLVFVGSRSENVPAVGVLCPFVRFLSTAGFVGNEDQRRTNGSNGSPTGTYLEEVWS